MSDKDILEEAKELIEDIEDYSRTDCPHNIPLIVDLFEGLIAKVESLTKERDELKKKITNIPAYTQKLEAENVEWVAKSHAWLTASMAQDDEITSLKASLEAWENRVNTDGTMWEHQRKDLEQKLEASEKKVDTYRSIVEGGGATVEDLEE